jgi:hypothetical protein
VFKRLFILTALFSLGAIAYAQQVAPEATASAEASIPQEREIYTVLRYGDAAFEPGIWLASASEQPNRANATWRADSLNAVAYLDYIHFNNPYNPDTLDQFFGDEWFKGAFANYQAWRRSVMCKLGDVTLHEFNLENQNVKLAMRYWIKPINPNRALTLFIVFPIDDAANLDKYSQLLFPDASTCAKRGPG